MNRKILLILGAIAFYLVNLYAENQTFGLYRSNLLTALLLVGIYNPLKLNGKSLLLWTGCGCLLGLASFFVNPRPFFLGFFFAFLLLGAFLSHTSISGLGKLIIFGGGFVNLWLITSTMHTDIQYDFPSCYNYMEYIINTRFKFWTVNPIENYPSYSSYHPILHFFLGAASIYYGSFLVDNISALNEAAQILFWSYMVWYYFICEKILRALRVRPAAYLCCLAFICFFPIYNAIAGYYNNDCLLLPLQAGTIYYSLLYYYNGGKKNLFGIWIFATLGALTKLSAVLVLPLTALLLFLRLLKYKHEFMQMLVFGLCLCGSLAIWPLYQYYVLEVGATFVPPQEHLSLAGYTMEQRFNPLSAFVYEKMFYNDYGVNLWETMTKTALFGQWDFSQRIPTPSWLLGALVLSYKVILALLILSCFFLAFHKSKKFWFALILILGLLGGHVTFGLLHPYMCNMDFRYVAVIVLPMAMILAMAADKSPRPLRVLLYSAILVFVGLSTFTWIKLVW